MKLFASNEISVAGSLLLCLMLMPLVAASAQETADDSVHTTEAQGLRIQILEPNDQPVTDNNFTFDTASFPNGKAVIPVVGTSGVSSEDPGLQWELTPIEAVNQGVGSTLASTPSPPRGASVSFRYNGLPSLNDQFGNKTLTLSHPQGDSPRTQTIKLFFSSSATNHPGAGTGVTPNWFFYWKQTIAAWGDAQYSTDTENNLGETKFANNTWRVYVGPANNGSYVPPSGINQGRTLNGIDNFAWAVRHEGLHKTIEDQYHPNGPFHREPNGYDSMGFPIMTVDPVDTDYDGLPDALEGPGTIYVVGNAYSSDDANVNDGEHYVMTHQTPWSVGSADSVDWSNPGHQSGR